MAAILLILLMTITTAFSHAAIAAPPKIASTGFFIIGRNILRSIHLNIYISIIIGNTNKINPPITPKLRPDIISLIHILSLPI